METEIISPLGANNLPFKEMEPEKGHIYLKEDKKNKNIFYLSTFLFFLFIFILGIIIGSFWEKKKKTEKEEEKILPSPSVDLYISPTPIPTLKPLSLEEKLDNFGKKLEETDLQEDDLLPPDLDFKLRFETGSH